MSLIFSFISILLSLAIYAADESFPLPLIKIPVSSQELQDSVKSIEHRRAFTNSYADKYIKAYQEEFFRMRGLPGDLPHFGFLTKQIKLALEQSAQIKNPSLAPVNESLRRLLDRRAREFDEPLARRMTILVKMVERGEQAAATFRTRFDSVIGESQSGLDKVSPLLNQVSVADGSLRAVSWSYKQFQWMLAGAAILLVSSFFIILINARGY